MLNQLFIDSLKYLLNEQQIQLLINSLDQERVRSIRINQSKLQPLVFDELIKTFNLSETLLNNFTFFYKNNTSIGQHPYYHGGIVYGQDVSAGYVVSVLNIKEDDYVLDCCSAPGGKSGMVLDKLKTGFLLCNEIDIDRSKILKQNILKLSQNNVAFSNEPIINLSQKLPLYFNKVILDVPCSGESLYRRFIDWKKHYSINRINKLHDLQVKLLNEALDCCSDLLVYSTCTFNIYENELVIEEVLNMRDDFEIVEIPIIYEAFRGYGNIGKFCLRFYPFHFGEGGFICLLKRKNNHNNCYFNLDKLQKLKSYYNPLLDDDLYLRSLREQWPIIELNLEETYLYLNGQILHKNYQNGYYVITYNGVKLGPVKVVDNILKNHYPKYLRNRFDKIKYNV